MVDHFVKLFGGHLLGSRQIRRQAGIQIARAGAHHQSRRRREAHAGVHAFAVAHGGQAGAVSEMREDHAARRCRRVAEAREFFHQIGIGQTVETVALNSLGVEASRNRQQLGHARHGAVKRRVKTGHLGQFRMTLAERLDQFNLAGQMIRVVRPDAMQFIQQFLGDNLRLGVFHAVDHPVSHRPDRCETILLFEPVNQEIRRRFVIGGGEFAAAPAVSWPGH